MQYGAAIRGRIAVALADAPLAEAAQNVGDLEVRAQALLDVFELHRRLVIALGVHARPAVAADVVEELDAARAEMEAERDEYHSIAERRVRLGLLLSEIGQKNGVQISQQEMNRLIGQAASHGCELIVFPECALTAFFPHWHYDRQQEIDAFFEREMPGPETRPLWDEAARLGLAFCLGYAELCREGGALRRYNTAILVDRTGRIVGKYRKIHLPGHADHKAAAPFQHYASPAKLRLLAGHLRPGGQCRPLLRAHEADAARGRPRRGRAYHDRRGGDEPREDRVRRHVRGLPFEQAASGRDRGRADRSAARPRERALRGALAAAPRRVASHPCIRRPPGSC